MDKIYKKPEKQYVCRQWNQPGDHPQVFPDPNLAICLKCPSPETHGRLEGKVVCPSDWVCMDARGNYSVVSDHEVRKSYVDTGKTYGGEMYD